MKGEVPSREIIMSGHATLDRGPVSPSIIQSWKWLDETLLLKDGCLSSFLDKTSKGPIPESRYVGSTVERTYRCVMCHV
jgi:hypothetical protein